MIKSLATICLSLLILDALWLGLIGKPLYVHYLGHIARFENGSLKPLWIPALLVYVALVAGIALFVIPQTQNNITQAFIYGGLFGLITYTVYDLTNLAVVANWPWPIAIIDIMWGTFLCSVSSALGIYVQSITH